MKCFYKLQCDVLKEIQAESLEYLQTQTDLLKSDSGLLWNKISAIDYVKKCPVFVKYCNSLGLKIKEISFTIVRNDSEYVRLHIDELPVVAKINFPILNTKGTLNSWYEVPENIMKNYSPVINQFNKEYYALDDVNLEDCKLLAETELDQPIVFNSQIAHLVKISPNATYPRIVMPVMFFNEPVHYLT